MKSSQIVLTTVAALASTDAFMIAPMTKASSSALHLVPAQGKQLAAAFEAAATHLHDEPKVEEKHDAVADARNFVARVFSLPSTLLHPKEQDEEALYYPIVGFQFVTESCKALPPTAPGAASCRIPSTKEDVYGWWSAACPLGHPDSPTYGEGPTN